MTKYNSKLILSFLVIMILGGCSTVNTLDRTQKRCPNRKQSSVFREDRELVFYIAKEVVEKLGLEVFSEDKERGRIYARSPEALPILGLGEKIGVYVSGIDQDFTKVDVVLQKNFLLNVGYTDWRDKILIEINKYINDLSEMEPSAIDKE